MPASPSPGPSLSSALPLVWRRVLIAALCALCFVSLAVRWSLSTELPFVVDELVDLQLAVDVARGATLYIDRPWERTPGMTYLLALTSPGEATSLETADSARRVAWVASTLVALGTFWIALRLVGPRWGLLALALLLSYSSFLERGLRIRADLFATMLSLVALAGVCGPTLRGLPLFVSGVALGLAFVTTQKAVYFVAAFAVALIARHLWQARWGAWRPILLHGSLAGLGFFVAPLALAAWYWWQDGLEALIDQTVLYGAYVGLKADVYSGTSSFVTQTIERNLGLWLLALLGLWPLMRTVLEPADEKSSVPGARIALLAWAGALAAAYLQHTTKFPYIFINIAPALALLAVFGARQAFELARAPETSRVRRYVGLSLGVLAVFWVLRSTVVHHGRHLGGSSLRAWQEQTMNRVDALTEPTDAVLDGVGMAVTRRKATPHSMTARWFAEFDETVEGALVAEIESSQAPVAIWNYRLQRLPKTLTDLIRSRWVGYWGNILVAGVLLEHPGGSAVSRHEIVLPASIRYRSQVSGAASVTVDGEPVPPQGRVLSAGTHVVEVLGEASQVVIVHAGALENPVGPSPPRSLFPSYSE